MICNVTVRRYDNSTGDYIDTLRREVEVSDIFDLDRWTPMEEVFEPLFNSYPEDFPKENGGVNAEIINIELIEEQEKVYEKGILFLS